MKNKFIPLDEFFDSILYDKKKGYYSKSNPFGSTGDFVTSPGISFIFSEIIAIWVISFWERIGKPKSFNIVELGPGDGKLSYVISKTFEKFPIFKRSLNHFLYEKSETLKKMQKKKLKMKKVKWITNFSQIKNGPVIFFGNEFFDAIPIKQFKKNNNFFTEKYINLNKKSSTKSIFKKAKKKDIKLIKNFKTLKSLKFIEFPKMGLSIMDEVVKRIKNNAGAILLIDYGYIVQKNLDTLQSVKKHKKNDLFENLGKSDVTSLVSFNLLKEYFSKKKFKIKNIVTQSFFLKKMGILRRAEIVSKNMNFKQKTDLYYRIKRLLDHKEMGELFKVLLAFKNVKNSFAGFN